MVEMTVRQHHTVNHTVIDVAPEFRKRTGAKINHDMGRPALNQVATAALSWIWAGGTATQYGKVHAFRFLSVRAPYQLAGRIVTEPAPRGRFDGTFSRRLYSGRRP